MSRRTSHLSKHELHRCVARLGESDPTLRTSLKGSTQQDDHQQLTEKLVHQLSIENLYSLKVSQLHCRFLYLQVKSHRCGSCRPSLLRRLPSLLTRRQQIDNPPCMTPAVHMSEGNNAIYNSEVLNERKNFHTN